MKKVLIDRKRLRGGIYAKLIWNKFSTLCSGLRNGCYPIEIKSSTSKNRYRLSPTPDNFHSLTHKGINLYDVAIYNICVAAKCYIDEIDFGMHLPLISKYFNQAATAIDCFDDLFDRHRFQKAIIFHGYYLDQAVIRNIARKRHVPLLGIERTSHKDRLIWDDLSGIPINSPNAKYLFGKYPPEFRADEPIDSYLKDLAAGIKRIKMAQHSSPARPYIRKTRKPLVVFIGQVYTDASLLFFLNASFRNPIHVIREVIRCAGDDCELVIKLHPKEKTMNDPITHQKYDSLTYDKMLSDPMIGSGINRDSITVDHANQYDTYSIIEQADLVITINSQAGFEALLFNRPVITCGQSYFTGLGFTYDCRTPDEMPSLIQSAMNAGIPDTSRNLFKTFCYFFYEKYCLKRNRTSLGTLIHLNSD
jgi:hypothetical protein